MRAVTGAVASEEACRLRAKDGRADGRADAAAENSTHRVTGAREE